MIWQSPRAFHAADRAIALMPLEPERRRKPRFCHETPRERLFANAMEALAWLALIGAAMLVASAVRGWL